MSTWYSKEFGDGVQAFDPSIKVQEAFLAHAMRGQLPYDFAVFAVHDLRRNVVTAYFSPSSQPLAAQFNALPCEKPERSPRFGLLVGDARAWELLFPTQ